MAHKSQVWVADDEDAYARAHILNEKDNGTTVVQIEGRMGDTTLPTSECYKVNPENQDGGTLGTQSIVGGGGGGSGWPIASPLRPVFFTEELTGAL